MKDHEIRELVNQLRDVAIKYHGAGQLREKIARVVRSAIRQAGDAVRDLSTPVDPQVAEYEENILQDGNSPTQIPRDHGYRPDCGCTGCKVTARICAEVAGNSPVIPDGSEDTKRLNWLDAQNKRLNEYYGTSYGWKFDVNFQRNAMMLNDSNYPVMTVRQAIDEAIAAAPQGVQIVSEKIEQYRKKNDRCDVCTEGARGGCGTCAFNGNL